MVSRNLPEQSFKELIAKKHHTPPPHYFSSNLFIIQREPKGLLLCGRDREVFTPLGKEGGGKCLTKVRWVALMGQRLSGKFCG